MLLLITSTVIFLALSGLMAAVDAAVLSVTRPEIEVLVQNRKAGELQLRLVKQQFARSVVVIVIVTNTINVLGPIVISRQAFQLHGNQGIAALTIVLALGTIAFSEIIPKALGAHYAPLIARLSAPVIRAGRLVLYPLVVAFEWLSNQFTTGTRHIGTEEQIRSLVQIGHRAGYIESDEGEMIQRAFVLNDKTAGEIMTPLKHVKAIGATFTLQQAAAEVCRSEFSRYPVFGDSLDDIKGIVLSREILKAASLSRKDTVKSLTRPAITVEATVRSDQLLTIFRDQHVHLAIVRDLEQTVGVVTLEDVLEQLVGDIEDEKDVRLA